MVSGEHGRKRTRIGIRRRESDMEHRAGAEGRAKEQETRKGNRDWQTGVWSRKNGRELVLWLQTYLKGTLKAQWHSFLYIFRKPP